MPRSSKYEPGTQAIHADDDARGGEIVAPISQATTFSSPSDEAFVEAATELYADHFYVRYGTPNHRQVADVLAALEGADRALVTAAGMGAVTTIALALLRSGDHVIAQRTMYPGTTSLVGTLLERFGVESTTMDLVDPERVAAAMRPNTRLVLLETPSNPLLGIVDVTEISRVAHDHGALSIVDSTIATPINQRPLELGADLVWHSATKYLGGHSDVSAGVVAGRADLIEQVWRTHLVAGSVLGPFDAWLLLRGLRTLDVRMERHNASALAIARALEARASVRAVHYPGLASHPQHELARNQMRGFGGLVSFELASALAADRFLDHLALSSRAASFGSVHTIATRPAAMWGDERNYDAGRHDAIAAGVIRLSVGIESTADLLDDVLGALDEADDAAAG